MDTAEILLIEDNPSDVEYTREMLARSSIPHRLTVESDGESGLARVRGGRFDLTLLDLRLPRLSGTEVLRAIREDPRLESTRVIVLTTSEHERDVSETRELRADGYLTKPVTVPELEFEFFKLAGRRERV